VKLLLEANPAAARHKDSDGWTLAHGACFSDDVPAEEIMGILQLLMAAHKDAFEGFSRGGLPIHLLARQGPVEALEYLLDACPEAVHCLNAKSENLLHCVVEYGHPWRMIERRLAKVRLLCSRYPTMMLQREHTGRTPLHFAGSHNQYDIINDNLVLQTVVALSEAGGRTLLSTAISHPKSTDYYRNGWLPLGTLVDRWGFKLKTESLLSPWADAFRLMLRLYPEAAGIEGGRNDNNMCICTPYAVAVKEGLPVYYRRLLLRAAPHLDPAELRRLNWEERRMAMYVASGVAAKKPTSLFANKDLVRHVVSFL